MDKATRNKKNIGLTIFLCLLIPIIICLMVFRFFHLKIVTDTDYDKIKGIKKLYKIEALLDDKFLWNADVNQKQRYDEIYKKTVDTLGDKYTRYMNQEETKRLREALNNKYIGIGVYVSKVDNRYKIDSVVKGSPADEVGVKANWYIISVDSKVYENMDELIAYIRGKAGTTVNVVFETEDGKLVQKDIVRGEVTPSSVNVSDLGDHIGYMQIVTFAEDTATEVKKAIDELKAKGDTKLILDLRDNLGGLLDSSIKIADDFLPKTLITYTLDNKKHREDYYSSDDMEQFSMVVLVNENTASAAEILTAALKDNNIPIIGCKTFGKGIIQETLFFQDGTSVAITSKEYFSPKGTVIHQKGIMPTYQVANDKVLDYAIWFLKQ